MNRRPALLRENERLAGKLKAGEGTKDDKLELLRIVQLLSELPAPARKRVSLSRANPKVFIYTAFREHGAPAADAPDAEALRVATEVAKRLAQEEEAAAENRRDHATKLKVETAARERERQRLWAATQRRLAAEQREADERRRKSAEEKRRRAEEEDKERRAAAARRAVEECRVAEEERRAAERRAADERRAAERRAAEERQAAEDAERRAAGERLAADLDELERAAADQRRAADERHDPMEVSVGGYDFKDGGNGVYYPRATTYAETTYPAPTHTTTTYTTTTYRRTPSTYMGYSTTTPSYAGAVKAAGVPSRPSVSPPRAGPILQVGSRDRPRRRNSPWRY